MYQQKGRKNKPMFEFKFHILELTLRVFLGVLFFAQGYDKVFRVKISGVIETFHTEMESKHVPSFMLVMAAYYTSIVELVAGAMLILGLFKFYALTLLGIDLMLVTCAFSILQPMWDMQYVFPRLVILTVLFLLPEKWEIFSIDFFITNLK